MLEPGQVFAIAMGVVILGAIPAFLFWRTWFAKDPFRHDRIGRWKGFRRKTQGEMRLEEARKRVLEGSFGMALDLYRAQLVAEPENIEARLGVADSLWELSIRGTKKEPEKRAEALVHYRWLLERYSKSGETEKSLALTRRLEGPFSKEELGL